MASAESVPPQSETVIRVVPVTDLRFDSENPRLPDNVDGSSPEDILGWMLADGTLLELMGSIGAQGYFPGEPLLVSPSDEDTAGPPYRVVEGNRRLAAVMLLADPTIAPSRRISVGEASREAQFRPTSLPVVVFPHRDEILDYLGYRHVTGVKEWSPLAKARYLRQLWAKSKAKSREAKLRALARRIGSRSDYVAKLLAGLQAYERIREMGLFAEAQIEEEDVGFSVLTTALSYSAISEYVGARPGKESSLRDEGLKDLTEWIYAPQASGKPIVSETRDLRQLAAVVARPEAVSALKGGASLADAVLLTEEPGKVFRQALIEARDRLRLANVHIHQVPHPRADDIELLDTISVIAHDLMTLIRMRLAEPPKE